MIIHSVGYGFICELFKTVKIRIVVWKLYPSKYILLKEKLILEKKY